MRKILVLAIFIASCCHQTKLDPIEIVFKDAPYVRTYEDKLQDAWQEAENNELIAGIESSNVKKWISICSENVILSDYYQLELWLSLRKDFFIRIAIFEDGKLFLDNSERKISYDHKVRLMQFYNETTTCKKCSKSCSK